MIPSAGPYRVASYTPGQGVVLTRNPNYHGSRPHRLARIELAVGIPDKRAVAQVEAGTADYVVGRRGRQLPTSPGSPLATAREAQPQKADTSSTSSIPGPQLDFFALNTHRPLFADARLRQAVNYAIDRAALARLGDEYTPLPAHPTDHYLPPGVPGYRNGHIYPSSRTWPKQDSSPTGTPAQPPCSTPATPRPATEQAQILKNNLAAIGMHVDVKTLRTRPCTPRLVTPGEPFDIAYLGWAAGLPGSERVL